MGARTRLVGGGAVCLLGVAAVVAVVTTTPQAEAAGDGALAGALLLPPGAEPATVELIGGAGKPIASVQTDAAGAFRFPAIAAGDYGVRVHLRQPANLPAGWGYSCPLSRRLNGIRVAAGSVRELGQLPVERVGAALHVRVTSSDRGAPSVGVKVIAWTPGRPRPQRSESATDDGGIAKLDLPLRREGEPVYVIAGYSDGGGLVATRAHQVMPLAWGTSDVAISVGGPRLAVGELAVTSAVGGPHAAAEVLLLGADSPGSLPFSIHSLAQTDGAGVVGFHRVAFGRWRIAVRPAGLAWFAAPVEVSAQGFSPAEIRVPTGVKVEFKLGLTVGGHSLAAVHASARALAQARYGRAEGRTFPSLAMFLLDSESGRRVGPMVPDVTWSPESESEPRSLDGVLPGKYRAIVMAAFAQSGDVPSHSLDAGEPIGAFRAVESWTVLADGIPPAISEPFVVPDGGAASVTLAGETALARAASLATAWPPFSHATDSMIRVAIDAVLGR